MILAGSALDLPVLSDTGEITLLNTVPSVIAELVRRHALPASLRTVNLAGEPLDRSLATAVHGATAARLLNLYGPSEDTTYSTWSEVEREETGPPTIGRPLSGTRTYLLDFRGAPVPEGVSGELILGGSGLARGYLGRPDLTAERFVPAPFGPPGSRLYRTGDLARWRRDGQIEFLGRADRQIKLRGFRIELGEIEAALLADSRVRAAAVAVHDDSDVAGRRLIAHAVLENPGDFAASGEDPAHLLRARLRESLPDYMLPSTFVFLEALPLTPSGKIDRDALRALKAAYPDRRERYEGPRNAVEQYISTIWMELLRVESPGIHDDFFELGGHSLLASRLVARLSEAFGVEIPLQRPFASPTIAGLATAVEEALLDELEQLSEGEATRLIEESSDEGISRPSQ